MFLVHQPINVTSGNYVPGNIMAFQPTIEGVNPRYLFEFEDEHGKCYIGGVGGMPEREHTFYYGDGKYEFCFYADQHWDGNKFDVEVTNATIYRFHGPKPRINPDDFDRIARNIASFFFDSLVFSSERAHPFDGEVLRHQTVLGAPMTSAVSAIAQLACSRNTGTLFPRNLGLRLGSGGNYRFDQKGGSRAAGSFLMHHALISESNRRHGLSARTPKNRGAAANAWRRTAKAALIAMAFGVAPGAAYAQDASTQAAISPAARPLTAKGPASTATARSTSAATAYW